jgi:hypothetical protein
LLIIGLEAVRTARRWLAEEQLLVLRSRERWWDITERDWHHRYEYAAGNLLYPAAAHTKVKGRKRTGIEQAVASGAYRGGPVSPGTVRAKIHSAHLELTSAGARVLSLQDWGRKQPD